MPSRHVRAEYLEELYTTLVESGRVDDKAGVVAKTVLEVRMIPRRALAGTETRVWNAVQLTTLLEVARGRGCPSESQREPIRNALDAAPMDLPSWRYNRPADFLRIDVASPSELSPFHARNWSGRTN